MRRKPIDKRVAGHPNWHPVNPALDLLRELLFQNLFAEQCRNLQIKNDFYPVGAAANYTLLYLLARLLSEFPVRSTVEFGSGQSTLLIDRLRHIESSHLAVEHDPLWHTRMSQMLRRCEYVLRPIQRCRFQGESYDFYSNVESRKFDLLVVDGPHGSDSKSRFGCVPYAVENASDGFVIIVDDFNREGEQETTSLLLDALEARNVPVRAKEIRGAKAQLVIASGEFTPFLYCW